jgi:hypothetical protein
MKREERRKDAVLPAEQGGNVQGFLQALNMLAPPVVLIGTVDDIVLGAKKIEEYVLSRPSAHQLFL